MKSLSKQYAAIVIGGGPAGLAAVSRLLDTHTTSIAWVDPAFQGGRLVKYPEVPSNTKVNLFLKFANVSPSLASLVKGINGSRLALPSMGTLQKMDPNQGCLLSLVQSMCQELSSALIQQFPSVLTPVQGWVKNIFFNSSTSMYECETYPGVIDTFQGLPSLSNLLPPPMSISTSKLILCTGSEPRVPPTLSSLSSRWIPLEVCLTPSLLRQEFSKTQPPRTIHVVGGSHSAVLCVKNLYDVLGDHNDQIYLDTRHPFVYAEEDPEGKGIRHDNRGLKLIAAEFAKLLERSQVPNVHVGRLSSSFTSSKTPMDAHVLAIGYQRRRTVHLFLDHHDVEFRHDPHLGHLEVVYPSMDPPPQRLPKAFGFGIAFPERIRDLSGDFEWNVGLWKFMNYIQRVLH